MAQLTDIMDELGTATASELTSDNKLLLKVGTAMKSLAGNLLHVAGTNIYNTSTYTSLDDLPVNSSFLVSAALDNRPGTESGEVFTFSAAGMTSYVCQIYADLKGKMYWRVNVKNVWSSWSRFADYASIESLQSDVDLRVKMLPNVYDAKTYASMDDLPKGSTALVSYALTNRPGSEAGIAFTFASSTSQTYASQIFVNIVNEMYWRVCKAGTWSSWSQTNDFSTLETKSEAEFKFDSLYREKGVPACTKGYYIGKDGKVYESANFKYSETIHLKEGYGIFFRSRGYQTNVALLSSFDGTNYKALVVSKDNVEGNFEYKNWSGVPLDVAISGNSSVEFDYVIYRIVDENNPSICCFDSVGALGDSYTEAELYNGSTSLGTFNSKYSWLSVLAKECGFEKHNYGVCGATTRSAKTNSRQLPKLLADDAHDLYLLTLGINDYYSLGSDYIGTADDCNTTDYTQSGDSFYGNYYYIIKAIQSHAPKAIVLMITPSGMNESTHTDFFTAAKNIASIAGIPIIDSSMLLDYSAYTSMQGGHPTITGYATMAKVYRELVEGWMSQNSVNKLVNP